MADKCLVLLQTLKMKEYIRRNSAAAIRVLYPVLLAVVRDHWHEGLQRSAFDMQQWLKGLPCPTAPVLLLILFCFLGLIATIYLLISFYSPAFEN